MKDIFKALARWIDDADAGEITAVMFVAGMCVAGVLCALAAVIHGFPF